MKNRNSFINLVFPYLDYAFNYIDEKKNDISKYDSTIKLDQFMREIDCGRIIPNFPIKPEINDASEENIISIREFFNKLNKKKSI